MNRKQRRAEKKQAKPTTQEVPANVQELFANAFRHHQAGRPDDAERLYRQVLAVDPRHAESLHLLGVIADQKGQHDLAVELIRNAIAINANAPTYHSNLGVVLERQGKLDEAITSYRKGLKLKPDFADAYNNLGNALKTLGQLDEAVASCRKALDFKPAFPEAYNNLANALKAQGHLEEAIVSYRKAIDLKPDFAEAHNNLGNAFRSQGRLVEAIACHRRALDLNPTDAEAHNNLGNALVLQRLFDDAAVHYKRAIALRPHFADAYNNLGNILQLQEKLDDAVAHYEHAIALKPNFVDAYNNLGSALKALKSPESALNQFEKALAMNSWNPETHNNMGNLLRELGRLKEAQSHFENAVRLSPRNPGYYWSLAMSKQFTAGDPDIATMQKLSQDVGSLTAIGQIELHFALAKALADINQHKNSFVHLLQGNALKRQLIAYDETATLGRFERIETIFTPALMRSKQSVGNPSRVPVFILGMPRSGTTLVEQILASHPKVFGAGELKEFEIAAASLGDREAMSFPEQVKITSDEDLRQIGTSYLDSIRVIAPEAALITDKMPLNFHFIGLIKLALPHARIIHVSRNPVDTCLSCFSTLFRVGQPFSYDLAELGRYYRAYQALMQHWRNVLPKGAMLEVQYEEVVDDLEGQARRLVTYCELEWDDACLAFHKTERPVRTASVMQVRQPIYKSAVGRARVYEEFLGPLTQALAGAPASR